MKEKALILNDIDIDRILKRISHEIIERNKGSNNLVFIGIQKRGIPLALRIAKNISELENIKLEVGKLDITFYRDDLLKRVKPKVEITDIPFNIDDKDVVLVDDVLFTGRTIRASLDALIDMGRPKTIQLVVLIDRGHRELPIKADYVGKNIPTSLNEFIEVNLVEIDGKDSVTICEKD
ncbi:MAG: bifunctional pyr operon transcriptional regulator/uracil phosphoribosyltransferase PyrR [Actinobacteria bacterium]|nr:bifunctional pyr operon transcriptional regulator/uracil phosphoribosyltransferase PyrR [Actinomycetota bacterium]MBM3713251.1 bifunctional pyr operon transcriptional regulator/uracil phosphoribosyltransferase PyrR [Actinomycetota bacterium]